MSKQLWCDTFVIFLIECIEAGMRPNLADELAVEYANDYLDRAIDATDLMRDR